MESYVPPEEDSDDESDDEKTTKKPSAKKAKKDPNAPKVQALCLSTCMLSDVLTGLTYCHVANHLFPQRPMNPYMLFANSVRAQVREENPDMSMGDVVSSIVDVGSYLLLCVKYQSEICTPSSATEQRDWNSLQGNRRGGEGQVAIQGRCSERSLQKRDGSVRENQTSDREVAIQTKDEGEGYGCEEDPEARAKV